MLTATPKMLFDSALEAYDNKAKFETNFRRFSHIAEFRHMYAQIATRRVLRQDLKDLEKEYGEATYVYCIRCGRKLSNPKSIRDHMGAKCKSKTMTEAKTMFVEA